MEKIRKYLLKLGDAGSGQNIFVVSNKEFTEQLGTIKSVTYLHSVEELEQQVSVH